MDEIKQLKVRIIRWFKRITTFPNYPSMGAKEKADLVIQCPECRGMKAHAHCVAVLHEKMKRESVDLQKLLQQVERMEKVVEAARGCKTKYYGSTLDEMQTAKIALDLALQEFDASDTLKNNRALDISPQNVHIEPVGWKPIETAPLDNMRPLILAEFTDEGKLLHLDWDGAWEFEYESWEIPQGYYLWKTAYGRVENPTHWTYQDEPIPPFVGD